MTIGKTQDRFNLLDHGHGCFGGEAAEFNLETGAPAAGCATNRTIASSLGKKSTTLAQRVSGLLSRTMGLKLQILPQCSWGDAVTPARPREGPTSAQ